MVFGSKVVKHFKVIIALVVLLMDFRIYKVCFL
ncbi:hypothetical protein DFO73_106104 [Cytobacillus oceanisediminis]|uniref:Uncharacterized protein n=1 Tax=Cytobacillus oceanisediminis TaxID=665099 RepID=A0A2V2ZV51_9BACI|nr:hypothetical protein DFO73_106104 [Cytobacillus oceanisediminis]